MSDDSLDDATRDYLEHAREGHYMGLDLRFEGGPHVRDLDRLCDRGLLEHVVHGPDYMVSYRLTEAGRSALAG